MKKSFIFAFVAVVAMIAASCQPKVEAPKARFTAVVDGLVVTFTNASKDAESYAWDFGDGSAVSAEENPVHTYAEAGTYTVVLTAKNKGGENKASQAVVVEKKAWSIAIDGDFADWAELPADQLAQAVVDENATTDVYTTTTPEVSMENELDTTNYVAQYNVIMFEQQIEVLSALTVYSTASHWK